MMTSPPCPLNKAGPLALFNTVTPPFWRKVPEKVFAAVRERTPSKAFSKVLFTPLITPEMVPEEPFNTPIRESAAMVTGPEITPVVPEKRRAP